MTDSAASMTDNAPAVTTDTSDRSMTLAEAAAVLGVSERTVLRRIEAGKLQGDKLDAGRGAVWRVILDGVTDTTARPHATMTDTAVVVTDPAATLHFADSDALACELPPVAAFARAMIDELRQEYRDELEQLRQKNLELSAGAAHWQARAQAAEQRAQLAEDQVKLLMAPKDEAPSAVEPAPAQPRKAPRWRRLVGRI